MVEKFTHSSCPNTARDRKRDSPLCQLLLTACFRHRPLMYQIFTFPFAGGSRATRSVRSRSSEWSFWVSDFGYVMVDTGSIEFCDKIGTH